MISSCFQDRGKLIGIFGIIYGSLLVIIGLIFSISAFLDGEAAQLAWTSLLLTVVALLWTYRNYSWFVDKKGVSSLYLLAWGIIVLSYIMLGDISPSDGLTENKDFIEFAPVLLPVIIYIILLFTSQDRESSPTEDTE